MVVSQARSRGGGGGGGGGGQRGLEHPLFQMRTSEKATGCMYF